MTDRYKTWNPTFLSPISSTSNPFTSSNVEDVEKVENSKRYALIILNTPIHHKHLFQILWNRSSLHYCADGGANRLLSTFPEPSMKPDLIIGDLDSLEPSTNSHYSSRGVPIVKDPDQNSTDLGKAFKALKDFESNENLGGCEGGRGRGKFSLIVHGGLGGRLDQTMSMVSFLCKEEEEGEGEGERRGEEVNENEDDEKKDREVWVVDWPNLTCFMKNGNHAFNFPPISSSSNSNPNFFSNLPTVGLIPIQGPVKLTTLGLEWDLDERISRMGELVSSSNRLGDKGKESRRVKVLVQSDDEEEGGGKYDDDDDMMNYKEEKVHVRRNRKKKKKNGVLWTVELVDPILS